MSMYDLKTVELLKDLASRGSFKLELAKERKRLLILESQLKNKHEEDNIYSKKHDEKMRFAFAMYRKYRLHKSLIEPIFDIIEDSETIQSMPTLSKKRAIMQVYGGEISFHLFDDNRRERNHKVVVTIYPGASKQDIFKMIESNWKFIEGQFKKVYPERYQKRVKIKSNRKRDELIGKLHTELGVIKSDGNFNETRAKEYLKDRGINNVISLRKGFVELGINLPPTAIARKKIIDWYKALEKM